MTNAISINAISINAISINDDNDEAITVNETVTVIDQLGFHYAFRVSDPRPDAQTPANTSGVTKAWVIKLPSGRLVSRQYFYGTGRDRYVYYTNTGGEFNLEDTEYVRSVLPKWGAVSVPFSKLNWFLAAEEYKEAKRIAARVAAILAGE